MNPTPVKLYFKQASFLITMERELAWRSELCPHSHTRLWAFRQRAVGITTQPAKIIFYYSCLHSKQLCLQLTVDSSQNLRGLSSEASDCRLAYRRKSDPIFTRIAVWRSLQIAGFVQGS
jgi:hypothetical protein